MKTFVVGVVVGMSIMAGATYALTSGWTYSSAFTVRGSPGLTKREYAAITAMQGLLARGIQFGPRSDRSADYERIARLSWQIADALAATQTPDPGPRQCPDPEK